MGDRIVSAEDISWISTRLKDLDDSVHATNSNVVLLGNHINALKKELHQLSSDFAAFSKMQRLANRAQTAETRLVKLRQEIEQKFGHYAIVRRTMKGILQANDLGIVRRETITAATEELMLHAPEYWLAPALVALSAWISDREDLAQRALREAMHRDDEKTSLLFALICRRADRSPAALQWVRRYLDMQDETALDRKAILIIDAYANGLFGRDSEGMIQKQLDCWIERLAEAPDFIAEQEHRWREALLLFQPEQLSAQELDYPYLKKYSKTWNELAEAMCAAHLHERVYDHFYQIFWQEPVLKGLIEELDRVLESLVTDFDDAEQSLHEAQTLEQLVIEAEGDEARAKREMQMKQQAFEERRNFMQLVTDAAMNPAESRANITVQKMAIAFSRDWILSAYRDVIAKNRMAVPHTVQFSLGAFTAKTQDGENETEVLEAFTAWAAEERSKALSAVGLSAGQKLCGAGAVLPPLVGIIGGPVGIAVGAVISTIMFLFYRSAKKDVDARRQTITDQYTEDEASGIQIIRALMAEVVDYRAAFQRADESSTRVTDFLTELHTGQFVLGQAAHERRVQI